MCLCKAAEAEINCARFTSESLCSSFYLLVFIICIVIPFSRKHLMGESVQHELGCAELVCLRFSGTLCVFLRAEQCSCRSETGEAPEVKELHLKAASQR